MNCISRHTFTPNKDINSHKKVLLCIVQHTQATGQDTTARSTCVLFLSWSLGLSFRVLREDSALCLALPPIPGFLSSTVCGEVCGFVRCSGFTWSWYTGLYWFVFYYRTLGLSDAVLFCVFWLELEANTRIVSKCALASCL